MNGGQVSGIALRRELMSFAKQRQKREDRIADQITAFAGSLQFVYIHVVWFTAWIIINASPWAFDPRIEQARVQQNEVAPGGPAASPQTPGARPGA